MTDGQTDTVRWPKSQPTATTLFQSPLYGSGTVFRSISHLLRHFPSSALTWRHTSSNSVTRNYCCRARELTMSFMDTLIDLTYLLTSQDRSTYFINGGEIKLLFTSSRLVWRSGPLQQKIDTQQASVQLIGCQWRLRWTQNMKTRLVVAIRLVGIAIQFRQKYPVDNRTHLSVYSLNGGHQAEQLRTTSDQP